VSWVTFYLKLRLEERVMEGVFPEGYAAYRKRVRAALVPFVI
jgi:protein-S-isoprenylcysteine O-methyltransferase Ste14